MKENDEKENNYLKFCIDSFIGFGLVLAFVASILCLVFYYFFNVPKLEEKYKKALSVEENIESDILKLKSEMHIVKKSDHETDIYGTDEQIELYNSLQIARQKAIEKRRKAESDVSDAKRIINSWNGYKLYKKYTELGSEDENANMSIPSESQEE